VISATSLPRSFAARAARIPAIPPPTISVECFGIVTLLARALRPFSLLRQKLVVFHVPGAETATVERVRGLAVVERHLTRSGFEAEGFLTDERMGHRASSPPAVRERRGLSIATAQT